MDDSVQKPILHWCSTFPDATWNGRPLLKLQETWSHSLGLAGLNFDVNKRPEVG